VKATVETKEITITTRVYTLEVTEEELRVIEMGVERMSSSYVTRKNPALAAPLNAVTRGIDELLGKAEREEEEEDDDEDDDL
jgi:hypothetical protein